MIKGLFTEIPEAEYRIAPAINKSGLDDLAISAFHYWARNLDPNRVPRDETPAMRLGSAIHCATLEPFRFSEKYVGLPDGLDRRTKEGKARYEELVSRGKIILSGDDVEVCTRISSAMRSSAAGSVLFGDGESEVTIFWQDPETGVQCKARADRIARVEGVGTFIVDVKSTEDASPGPHGFSRSVWAYKYHRQADWYLSGYEQATGEKAAGFIFAAFEKKAPYACAYYRASDAMLAIGRAENRRLIKHYAECLKAGNWPSYPDEIQTLELPAWVKAEPAAAAAEMEIY